MSVVATSWQRLEALFHQSCLLPVEAREAFARAQAGDDVVLRDALLAMLAVESQATLRVRAPLKQAVAALRAPLPELPAGTRFGAWAIDRLIGAGGMGQVYLGHRADGAYEREVAIKLVAADALDVQGRALFEFECRLLAQMVHPAIAQIHDVGTDAHGRPYLVMEYLRGEPITWWCDAHLLSLHARVLLMLRVSEAVQHAHQKGVIHRDLKPSNVLVSDIDGRPMPGVIDFGIAIDAANPGMTSAHGRGTPGYMSPEQARGEQDVDARSDIYALGAMFYELSCGLAPVAGQDGLPQPPRSAWRQCRPMRVHGSAPHARPPTPDCSGNCATAWMRSCCARWRPSPLHAMRRYRPCWTNCIVGSMATRHARCRRAGGGGCASSPNAIAAACWLPVLCRSR
ncbi:serine/threonine protein kinase [Xanthomonas hortorum pv. pelargonii]|nr:serine/threonine protein kinase [Xanthomonas hortorum pv. pelargonii]